MSCTALEMRCNAVNDIQMQVGAAPDDQVLINRVHSKLHMLNRQGVKENFVEDHSDVVPLPLPAGHASLSAPADARANP